MEQHTVEVNEAAMTVLNACNHRVNELGRWFGWDSSEYREAEQSLRNQLVRLLASPMAAETKVYRDAELSLYCVGGLTFGLVFHRTRRHCLNEGCKAVIEDDGKAWVYSPDWPMCDDHKPSYPLDFPTPGTWSFHS